MDPCNTDLTMEIDSQNTGFHNLNNKWNLWAHLPQDPDWTVKSYKRIIQFNNVEETIAVTESLPEGLVKNCMLFVMKDGITPMWEDHKNRNGGCFSYKVSNKNVFEVWRDLTYVLTGETISSNSQFVNCVTGITISPKKNFCIIKIWMTNCDHQNPHVITNELKHLQPHGCLFKKHTPEF
uniref:Eukaryotic translation initiation factor 4E n=1 Tax=viral metagenome TaxID=1070528 RepID=A0A6C0KQH4_9ZZZZ